MPFCYVSSYQAAGDAGIKIFYRTYGGGPNKVLMIIGLAGTHDSWLPQIKGLTGTVEPNDDQLAGFDRDAAEVGGDGNDAGDGVEVCAFDNRGMGRSSVPTKKSEYTTTTMAKDAIALMDHLGWRKAHVFGHSMGAMIACKFAALVPDRVLSLALLNVTGGGYQCFPKIDRQTLSIAIRFLRAKTPEQRAAVDLDTHYSKEYLEEYVGPNKRRALLYQEYVKGISASGMQSNYGFAGQINACWMHKMSLKEIESIRSAGFLISVIHGRHDVIAQLYHAKRLADKLHPFARMVELHGGHLVSHERTEEVNQALLELIEASKAKISPYDWANLPTQSSENLNGMATQTGSLSTTQQPSLTLIVNESTLVGGPTMIHGPFGSRKRLSLNLHNGQMKSTLSSKKLRPSLGLLFSAVTGWTVTRISFGSTMVDTLDKLRLLLLYFFGLFVLVFEYLQRGLRRLKPVRVGPALT